MKTKTVNKKMKTVNKYIISISSFVVVSTAITTGVLLSSNSLSPVIPKLDLKLTSSADGLTPEKFVENIYSDGENIDNHILEEYVSGIPVLGDDNFEEINKEYIINITKVSYNSKEDTNYVILTIMFQSRLSSFNQTIDYKLEGLQYESQNLFNNLIVTANSSAKNILSSKVNLRNYPQYIKFNIKNSFPDLNTNANYSVTRIVSNDSLGSLELELLYKKGDLEIIKKVSVSGFQTSDTYDKKQLSKYVAEVQSTKNPLLAPITLPSEINESNLYDYVTISSNFPLIGVETKVLQVIPEDASGILKVKINYKYKKSNQTKDFTISNFQTITQRRRALFEQFCKSIDLRINKKVIDDGIKASQININNIRVYVDGIPDSAEYPVKILSVETNDLQGFIRVKLEVTGDNGSNIKKIDKDVYGFYIPSF